MNSEVWNKLLCESNHGNVLKFNYMKEKSTYFFDVQIYKGIEAYLKLFPAYCLDVPDRNCFFQHKRNIRLSIVYLLWVSTYLTAIVRHAINAIFYLLI